MTMHDRYVPHFVIPFGMDHCRMYVEDFSVYQGTGEDSVRVSERDHRTAYQFTYEFWEDCCTQHPSMRLLQSGHMEVICDQGYVWMLTGINMDRDICRRMIVLSGRLLPMTTLRITQPVSALPAITSKLRRDLHL